MRKAMGLIATLLVLLALTASGVYLLGQGGEDIRVGSKKFTESVVLAQVLAIAAEGEGAEVEVVERLGSTPIVFEALRTGSLDGYVDYTGTVRFELLADEAPASDAEAREMLAEMGIGMSEPLGFNNTYAIGVLGSRQAELGVGRISDLASEPELRLALNPEFIERADGWNALRAEYGLPQTPLALEHEIAYEALAAERIEAKELYTTDARIERLGIAVLEDDREFFPRYEAVILYRLELEQTHPEVVRAWRELAGTIDEPAMRGMNAAVDLDNENERAVAARFVGVEVARGPGLAARLLETTAEHLVLVGVSLGAAIAVAIPLGLAAAYRPKLGQAVLALVGVVQTIPALALLLLLIAPLGLGAAPAIAALFVYSLLPIVRNTHAGLVNIPTSLKESARVMGLRSRTVLARIEIRLAAPTILAGVKTAAVINVGLATLGAFVGSGGYGEPIYAGLTRGLGERGFQLILEGAVPAIVLAVLTQIVFDLIERAVTPPGIRG